MSNAIRCGCITAFGVRSVWAWPCWWPPRPGVQHAFWVVLGTLSVLRSNALSTGQNAIRGLLGTVVGFVIGALLLAAIGTNATAAVGAAPLRHPGRRAGPGHHFLCRRAGRVYPDPRHPVQHRAARRVAGRSDPGRGHRHRLRGERGGGAAVLASWGGHRSGRGVGDGLQRERPLPGRARSRSAWVAAT